MRRLIVSSAILALVAACAHSRGKSTETSTTTVTSGAPGGVRVTNVRESEPDPGLALADELCRREVSCNRIGAPGGRYPTEEACMADLGTRMPAQIASWNCSPAAERARFKDCLAAVREEDCNTDLVSRTDRLPVCRQTAVCPPIDIVR